MLSKQDGPSRVAAAAPSCGLQQGTSFDILMGQDLLAEHARMKVRAENHDNLALCHWHHCPLSSQCRTAEVTWQLALHLDCSSDLHSCDAEG